MYICDKNKIYILKYIFSHFYLPIFWPIPHLQLTSKKNYFSTSTVLNGEMNGDMELGKQHGQCAWKKDGNP